MLRRKIEFVAMAKRCRLTYAPASTATGSGDGTLDKLESELRASVKCVGGGRKRKAVAKKSCWRFHYDGKTGKRARKTPCPPSKKLPKRTPAQHSESLQPDDLPGTCGHCLILLPNFNAVRDYLSI